jgi:alpha-galactosidase
MKITNKFRNSFILVSALIILSGSKNGPVGPLQLEAVVPQTVVGELLPKLSVNGRVINIGEFIYQNGIGTTIPSEITFKIPKGYQRFDAWVGFDIESEKGQAIFQVFVDGKLKFDSGLRLYNPFTRSPESNPDRPIKVTIPVSGASTLTLKVTTGEGKGKLFADWGDAQFCPTGWPEFTPRKKVRGIAETPPMGWNPWNWNGSGRHQDTLKKIADAIVDRGFLAAGYKYMNLDGSLVERQSHDENGFPLIKKSMFPKGLQPYTDYVHSKGLKFGMYAGMHMVGRQPGKEGMWNGGYEKEWVDSFKVWGVDYLKYDFSTREGNYYMLKAIKNAGLPIFYNACAWGHEVDWNWAYFMGANSIRSTYDVNNIWEHGNDINPVGIIDAIDQGEAMGQFTGPGFWNDLDMLVVGLKKGTAGRSPGAYTIANSIEQRTQFSLYSMMASALIIGCDIRSIDKFDRETLLNKEVIAIDQDKLGVAAWRVVKLNNIEIWKRPLDNGDWAIAVLNRGSDPLKIVATWDDMNLSGKFNVRDLWQQEDIGVYDKILTINNVASHETKVYRFSPANPQK